ncbi:MarR family winged helix-turn-helix transcriptional regulator [Streptomyces zhihengii]
MLSHLSEAPGRKLRMGELAFLASGSLSRLSNVIKRCEQRGWVVRTPDPTDGRYTLAELTDAGFNVVDLAAPTHARSVRAAVLGPLGAADRKALVRIAEKLRISPTISAEDAPYDDAGRGLAPSAGAGPARRCHGRAGYRAGPSRPMAARALGSTAQRGRSNELVHGKR